VGSNPAGLTNKIKDLKPNLVLARAAEKTMGNVPGNRLGPGKPGPQKLGTKPQRRAASASAFRERFVSMFENKDDLTE
jgi:hypothetical protein